MSLIDPQLLQQYLQAAAGRVDVDALVVCDSSNSELSRRAARGLPSGRVLVVDEQTAGRGRRGRSWLSTPADSLTFSLLWRFNGGMERLAGLSLAVGLALARALESLGAQGVALKWPNDVLLSLGPAEEEYAKLAGILVELQTERQACQAIIGIGLNLRAPRARLPQAVAGLDRAMSVLPDRHRILAALLDHLVLVLDRFSAAGFAAMKSEWLAFHAWQDQAVSLLEEGRCLLNGVARGLADDGSLLIETQTGLQSVYAGDVSLRRP